MINLEDLSDSELESLLFDCGRGKFEVPDFGAIHSKVSSAKLPLYQEWLAYMRACKTRAHFPSTFSLAFEAWRIKHGVQPIQIEFKYVQIVRSARQLRRLWGLKASGTDAPIAWHRMD